MLQQLTAANRRSALAQSEPLLCNPKQQLAATTGRQQHLLNLTTRRVRRRRGMEAFALFAKTNGYFHSSSPTPTPIQISALKKCLQLVLLVSCYYFVQNFHTPLASAQQHLLALGSEQVAPQEHHQHNNILKFFVEENKPNGTFVGTIRSADDQVPYLVLPSPQTPESELKRAFVVNTTTGDLTTNSSLDREYRDQYHFIAIVKEPFAEIKCTIEIKDVNDNVPKFLTPNQNETNIVIDMPEGQRGIRQVLPLAFDFDTPQFGIKEFKMISSNTASGTFQLVEHEAPARSILNTNANLGNGPAIDDSGASMLANDNPQLRKQLDQEATVLIPSQPVQPLTGTMRSPTAIDARSFLIDLEASQPLDRENQSSYQLVVEASDGGPLVGRLLVTVNVLDINDNDPVFSRKFYECQVSEDAPFRTPVQRVQAYDVDLDANGQVSYYLKRHTSSSQQAVNGSATPSQDYNGNSNNIEMVANRYSNSAGGKQQPRAGGGGGQAQTLQAVSKSAGNGQQQRSSVTTSAETQELPYKTKSTLSTSAFNSDQAPLFDIDPNKGEIYLVNRLDFESDQAHELLIEACDHGKPPRCSYTTVKVHVVDVHDDPPPMSRLADDRRQSSSLANSLASTSENGKAESSPRLGADLVEPVGPQAPFNFQHLNLAANWFSQMNSSVTFAIILVGLLLLAFPVCLVKIKSRQPESDYNDTAGLTLASNNGQTKPSPSHSASNIEHPNGMLEDSLRHRHHDHQRRPPSLTAGAPGVQIGSGGGKIRYPLTDSSSNHYHNPYPQQQRPRHHSSTSHKLMPESPGDHHRLLPGGGGLSSAIASRGGTMTMSHSHNHNHQLLLDHTPPGHLHSLDPHQHQFAGANFATGSLTYAHSNGAALLQQAHHHQSLHQLAPGHHLQSVQLNCSHLSKGGTMNSVGTHHSGMPNHHFQQSGSPMPATPNTIHGSLLQPSHLHDPAGHCHHGHHGHNHRNGTLLPSIPQTGQLPPTPSHHINPGTAFAWPTPQGSGSPVGCYPDGGTNHDTPLSTVDSCSSPAAGTGTPQPLDRLRDLRIAPQLVHSQDWCGSYNWDYLENWIPEYHTLMPLIQAEENFPNTN